MDVSTIMNYLLIGTYTKGTSEGIYLYKFNEVTGKARFHSSTKGIENPSYLAVSSDQKFVFAVNESGHSEGDFVSAFRFNSQTGTLDVINQVPSGGIDPCYVSVDELTRHLFVANYSSGSLVAYKIGAQGRLSDHIQHIQFAGKSIHPERQKQPHLHAAVIDPDKQHVWAVDLGADKIYSYQYQSDDVSEPLTHHPHQDVQIEKGRGPRHLVFNKDGSFAYLSTELKAGIIVFRYLDQTLQEIQYISMTEPDFTGTVSGADIHLSQDGRFLYASNRGEANELVVYAIDEVRGTLQLVERVSCLGRTPRNFVIDPSDRYVIVANQDSNDCFIFNRDVTTGKLSYTGHRIEVESPVCLKFIQTIHL